MVFVLLALFLGQFGSGVYDLVFSNFLRDAQHLDVEMRGLIEFPRELPGILSLFAVSLLFMFNEVRMAGVACLLMFGGMYALAFCGAGTSLWTLSAWILTVSLGQHILMGMIDTIVIHTARPENRSLRLGQMKALGTAAALLGALQTEALRVMARAGITPAQVTAVSPTLLPHVLRLPNWLFTRLAKRMLQIDATARSSMWDDLEAGRVTEIDALCGAVVRLAAQQGMAAPLNARMCELLGGPRQRLTGKQMRQMLGL